jgi:drug/metabolite transporter (DMT)-like permease
MAQINKGMLLVLATALISGLSIFLNSYAVKGFDSDVFTFSKNLAVAILLTVGILSFGLWNEIKSLTKKQWTQLSLIGLVGGSIPFILFFKGLQLGNATTGSFMHKIIFIPAAILAIIALKEKPKWYTVAGGVFILAGTWLMIKPALSFGIGEILIVTAVLFWSAENIIAKKTLKGVSGTTVAWARMAFGAIFILMYLAITGKAQIAFSMSGSQYAWIGITSALLFGYVFTYYNGLKTTSVTAATSILSLGAPITAGLAWTFQGKAISTMTGTGILLIIAGVFILTVFAETLKFITKQSQPSNNGRT